MIHLSDTSSTPLSHGQMTFGHDDFPVSKFYVTLVHLY